MQLLQSHGPQLSTKQIAQAAGIAEGTIFRAFGSLQELLSATVTAMLSHDRLAEMCAAKPFTGELIADINAGLDLVVDYYDTVSVATMLAHDGPAKDDIAACARTELRQRHGDLLKSLTDRFAVHRDELVPSPAEFAKLVLALAMGMRRYPGVPIDPLPRKTIVATLLTGARRSA